MKDQILGYLRRHHLALVALVVALGGTAYAANQVTSREIRNNTIRAVDLRKNSVKGSEIGKRFTVESSKVVPSGVSTFISVACPRGRRTLYSGAAGWSPGGVGTSLDGFDLGASSSAGGVTVSGTNASGQPQSLTARAYCLSDR